MQQLALPAALVEVQHRPGLLQEARIAREDPRAVLPRPDRVLRQPARDRRRRRRADGALDHQPVQLSAREARQRDAQLARQLARDRLDLRDLLRGKNGAGDQTALDPQDQSSRSRAKRLRQRPIDLGVAVQPPSDLGVAQPVGPVEHQLGPLHDLVRQRVARRPTLELAALLDAQTISAGRRAITSIFDAPPAAPPHNQTELTAVTTKCRLRTKRLREPKIALLAQSSTSANPQVESEASRSVYRIHRRSLRAPSRRVLHCRLADSRQS